MAIKYNSLPDYYRKTYDPTYFTFDKYQLEIDPKEHWEEVAKYDDKRQRQEHYKCTISFSYFAHKYTKITHPKKGLVPFILFNYQRRVIEAYDVHRFNILKKFRQGGLTTLTVIWCLWRCLYKLDQQIFVSSKTDIEALVAAEIVNVVVKNLPEWMLPPTEGKWNDHHKQFTETGGNMRFGTPERARGLAITYMIIDEAAHIKDMDRHWRAMYPTLSTGGNCIVISTVNGLGNWYAETYHEAKDKKKTFHVIDLEYTEHPEYNNEQWVREQKAQLSLRGWQQEILGDFLDSGSTYIPGTIIGDMQRFTANNFPKRRLFNKWVNGSQSSADDFEKDGAMWMWREPLDGHDYIAGVDCAEGLGDDSDNSCMQIFDQTNLEQVAEFYSNVIPPSTFAQVINELGLFYNHALLVVENMNPGNSVLSHLQHELEYDNLYYDFDNNRKNAKPGLKITPLTRNLILEAMQYRMLNSTVRINSKRFVRELTTFIYNRSNQRVESSGKGNHDDAIMAGSLALYVHDVMYRQMPAGVEITSQATMAAASNKLEEIRRELMECKPVDLLGYRQQDAWKLLEDDEIKAGVAFSFRRKNDKLLAEFGW